MLRSFRRALPLVLAWALIFAAVCAVQWWQADAQQQGQRQQLAQAVQRQLLEKVAQHSAHLTGLAALAPLTAAAPGQPSALEQVSQSILNFYPRIRQIELVPPTAEPGLTNRTPGDELDSCRLPASAQATRDLHAGESTSIADPLHGGDYLLLKKVAGPGAWLCMRIAAGLLLDAQALPGPAALRLQLHGITLLQPAAAAGREPYHGFVLQGYGQPLQAQLFDNSSAWSLLGWPRLLLSALTSLALALAASQLRRSRRQIRQQQQRALLLANETRLAHASRVNGMGQMASGIAHELAQPVTALLSQSQAALRALESDKPALVQQALQANVREARRAGDILQRMRGYMSNAPSELQRVDLAALVAQALLLLDGAARQEHIELAWQPPGQPWLVRADPVALEQVLHNLVRNAFDALKDCGREQGRVEITLRQHGGEAELRVRDNGPGIEPAVAQRIFEPFFTTKPSGMGLGLPLCATLMEHLGGRLEYVAGQGGACFALYLPLLRESEPDE